MMKKVLVLFFAILFLVYPNTVFAETTEYEIYVNYVKQPIMGIFDEELLLPINQTYDVLGGKCSFDSKFNSSVYRFNTCTAEVYKDDYTVYSSGRFLGNFIMINGIEYGSKNLFDIEDATMIIDDESMVVNFLTRDYIEKILLIESSQLQNQAPDLVNAINKFLLGGVESKFSVKMTSICKSTKSVVSENLYKRKYINVSGEGYSQLTTGTSNIKFDVELNLGNSRNGATDFQMRTIDGMLYIMNPHSGEWFRQSINQEFGDVVSLSLTQPNTFFRFYNFWCG